jgi:uncharacterized protein (DUF1330 family)
MNKTIIRAIFGIAITFGAASYVPKPTNAPSTSEKATQPHGYLVANYTVHDQATYQKYMEAAGPLAPKYNGKIIIYDVSTRTLEGNPKSVISIAEFPSVAAAEQFYNSPEYTAVRKLRVASTEGSVLLAESSMPPAITVGTIKPRGYMIANYNINDKETFQKYMDAAGNLPPKYDGKVTLFDFNAKTLEGNPKSVIGVAEFPSLADAERFYNSPEYTAARKFRIASTQGIVLLAESSVYAKQ